ncbi:hypothetical protein [Streptomyces sp. NPDC101150]|uniref:hypothetical protein n=1 Tax=Streptomyces sp. NPDC101150 TaxID=3366114 RepID=UPI0037F5B38E
MSSGELIEEPLDVVKAPRKSTGTTSLVVGALGVAMTGCPWLPTFVSHWIRFFPVYFILPFGIWAVVSGIGALRGMRGDEGADRRRARAGVTLGTVAILVPVAAFIWAYWALSRT